MKHNKSRRTVTGVFYAAILVLGVSVTQSVSRITPDCASPNGTFPVVPAGQHTDCDGYHNVSVDPVSGDYFWDSNGALGSYCYNQLRNNSAQSTSSTPTNACWLIEAEGGIEYVPPYGFRSSFNPWAQPGLGDFLSPSPTLAGSAACLVPSGAGEQSIWWNDATRQTLNQSVDLVTGMPLVQVNHLELPFDGATFRLTRTRSGHREDQRQMGTWDEYYTDRMSAMDRWWDWDGEGWMISESPLLVFDSAVPDIVGNNPRMSWLVLDAHHSIPFQQIESTGIYASPPRFNARMSHNGEWGIVDQSTGTRGWTTPPTQVDVYLYDGALQYTFVIIQDDVPDHIWNRLEAHSEDVDVQQSLNARPYLTDQFDAAGDTSNYESWDPLDPCSNPGLGLPYIGLCVKIQDQYNHVVEIKYSGIQSKSVDYSDPSTNPGNPNENNTDGNTCVECGQACARKGLIRSVKLKTHTASGTETRWSLIYAYRGFDDHPSNLYSGFLNGDSFRERDLFGSYQIDRIYVYEVNDQNPDPEQSIIDEYKISTSTTHDTFLLALDQSQVTELDGIGPDPLSDLFGSSTGVADQWTHLVQNHFLGVDDDVTATADGIVDWVWSGAVKVMTTVTSRIVEEDQTPSSSDEQTEKSWVYHYEGDIVPGQDLMAYPKQRDPVLAMKSQDSDTGSSMLHWLRRVYEPQDVARVLISPELGFSAALSLKELVYMLDPSDSSGLTAFTSSDDETELIASFATKRFERSLVPDGEWETSGGGSYDPREWTPEPQLLHQNGYLLNQLDRVVTDEGNRTTARVVLPGSDGRNHYYQVLRLYYAPIEVQDTTGLGPDDFVYTPGLIGYDGKQRSAFVHPYQWHGYSPATGTTGGWGYSSVTANSPELTEVRWITIIDEFASPADLYPEVYDETGYGVYEGQFGIKKSQLSRRVVELSPSGYLLRDRKWEFRDGYAEQSGGGLGEQFIYQTVEDYFQGTTDALPAAPTPGSGGVGTNRVSDEFAVIRNELLSVEYRSLGWSAAELNWDDGNGGSQFDPVENGYTRFTDYEVFLPDGETWLDYADDLSTTTVNEQEESEQEIPLQSRVQATATGFQRGSSFVDGSSGVGWEPSANPNPKLYTSQSIRNPDRPSDVVANVQFVTPATASNLLGSLPAFDANDPHPGSDADYQLQRVVIERREPTQEDGSPIPQSELPPEEEWPVANRMVIGTPRQVYPGSAWYYPVEREFYDDFGNPDWSCTGQLKDPLSPDFMTTDSYEVLTFTYFRRDDEGRSLDTVLDAVAGSSMTSADLSRSGSEAQFTIDGWPTTEDTTQWKRIGNDVNGNPTTALGYVTSFVYDDYAPGLCDVYYPNGRRWARRVITVTEPSEYNSQAQEYAREYIFNNLYLESGLWVTESDGEVKDYRSTDVYQPAIVTRNVTYDSSTIVNNAGGAASLSFGKSNQPSWVIKSAVQVGVDGNGRIQQATLLERAPDGAMLAVGTKEINDLGELYREQEIDRTITVQTRNSLGQTLRVYQGTEDSRWYDSSAIEDPNMVLLERTEYGGGVNDAWQPTVIRQYKRTPVWALNDLHGEPPAVDNDGIATVLHYDWQGRVVRTDSYEQGDLADTNTRRLSTTLVYYDFLDRPYLEVTYGEDAQDGTALLPSALPADIDPVLYVDAELFPLVDPNDPDLATEFLINKLFDLHGTGALTRPKSVTQSIYAIDGSLTERRSFDTGWSGTGDVTYLADFSYQGRGGTQIFSQSPGGSIEVTVLDSVGRVASVAQMAPSTDEYTGVNTPEGLKELTRIDSIYDADGNVVETQSWERIVDDATDKLGLSNAVRTRTLNWYDVHKRLVATAEIGTEQAGYLAGPESYVHSFPTSPGDDLANFPAPYWDNQTKVVVLPSLFPSDALVRVYGYNDAGNKEYSVDPEGIQTKYYYTATNRLAFKTENAAATDLDDRRTSGYFYQYGRLIEMNLVTGGPSGSVSLDPLPYGDVPISPGVGVVDADSYLMTFGHRTSLEYGADIVVLNSAGDEYVGVSRSNMLIGKMRLPNEQTGDPADDADIFLRYTFQGQIAERFSSSGEAFRYLYDDSGRLTSVETGTWDPAYPPDFVDIDPSLLIQNGETPTDVIRLVEYTHDERGNVTDVIAWSDSTVNRQQIAHTRMAYDDRDRLIKEWQQHGEGVINALKTPHMKYVWEYEPTDLGESGTGTARTGHDRMTSMTYPVPDVSIDARRVTFEYGTDGSDEDLLSRLIAYRSSIGTDELANFEYSGSGRRTGLGLNNNKIYSESDYGLGGAVGLNGFDQFGRKTESRYMGNRSGTSSDEVLYRANYTFDKVGNRISALIAQAPVGGTSQYNLRSTLNAYDGLHRLVGTQVGTLTFDTLTGAVNGINSVVHTDDWTLDALGNWAGEFDESTGDIVSYGRHTVGSLDSFGVPWSVSTYDLYTSYDFGVNHIVNQRNAIDQLGLFEQVDADPSVESSIEPVYDGGGRTLFDGEYGYHYDAWGRVVQISEATPDYDSGGAQIGFTYGTMLKHFVYDGYGRLIRTTSPVPDPQGGESTESRSLSFYYDGARRVQEILNDEAPTLEGAAMSGDSGTQNLAAGSTNENNPESSSTPMSLEKGINPEPVTRDIYREYVWGPGDMGPDELLLQTDELDDEYWCLMDGGGDLVALAIVDSNYDAWVVRQWTYDAYGAILSADHIGTSMETHVGHKGLFMDRLDVPMGYGDQESPRLVPYGHTVYQNRNRSYSPSLGRFLQMDPNMTAMALLSTTAAHGRGMGSIRIAFSMEGMYGDGLNLYQYLRSNPWTNSDPLGLAVDPFDLMDEIMDEHIGSIAGFAGAVGAHAAKIAVIAARIATYLPFPGVGIVGELALVAMGEQTLGAAIMGAAIGLVPGGYLVKTILQKSGLGKAIGKLASSFAKSAFEYVKKSAVGRIAYQAVGMIGRKIAKFVGKGCQGCFAASTLVLTANGPLAIADIQEGQQVLAASDSGFAGDYKSSAVGVKVVIGEASLVHLYVEHEDGSAEMVNTTDEHPFHVFDLGEWIRADQLRVGDRLSTITGTCELVGAAYSTKRVPVYNLSIPGTPTYYVGEHGIWVHNCGSGLHHLIPMYLGGAKSGAKRYLNSKQHSRLHVLINESGALRGIPKHSGRGNGRKGVDAWAEEVGQDHAEQKIREALLEAYQNFDAEQGTDLYTEMFSELLTGPVRK